MRKYEEKLENNEKKYSNEVEAIFNDLYFTEGLKSVLIGNRE